MVDVLDKTRQGLDPKLKEIVEEGERNFVYCRICSHVLTRSVERIEVSGSHEHHCTNPYGISFHIGCFAEALGCDISGEPMAADTWFAGFRWRHASCAECHQHLGWYFESGERYFYGLILDRIQND
ncbi:MAG: hypothetical protein GWM88_03690 [Pseudomonadales bacterium]|nr:hypothetical protein [Pseudomonadales bacterium]NIX07171.1 hypothetical protein [Pseudomonadales bacterium]